MVDNNNINKHGIFFGLHLYRRPEEPVFYSSMKAGVKLLKQHGYTCCCDVAYQDPYIQKARNKLVQQFLKSNCDTFIFVADDVEYSPEDMLRLIETPGDVVAGVYSKHTTPAEYPVRIDIDNTGHALMREDGCISAKLIQTGFLKIKRVVFEKIILHYPELAFYGIKDGKRIHVRHDFFPQGVNRHRWYGEDYAFCNLWTGIDGKIWIIPDITLIHYKNGKGYPGNFYKYLRRLPGGNLCKENIVK